MPASATDGLSWTPRQVDLAYTVGEIHLFTMKFNGIRSEPNIFAMPKLDCVEPPISTLRSSGRRVAYIYSCPLEDELPRFSCVSKHIRFVSSSYRHFYVAIDGEFSDYLANFKRKTLSTVKRKITKALSSNRKLELFTTYVRPEEMDVFFEAALAVSKKSYQHTLLGQGLPDDAAFRERVRNESAKGHVRGYVLFIEDAPAAYSLCPVYGGNVILYDHTGYDPRYSKYSPGTVLQYKVIESLFEVGGLDYYDLCTGEGRHKELFATGSTLCANVHFFPLTPHHLASVWLKVFLDQATSMVKSLLDRFGLRDRMKRFVRRIWR